jgi:hypothetical protein
VLFASPPANLIGKQPVHRPAEDNLRPTIGAKSLRVRQTKTVIDHGKVEKWVSEFKPHTSSHAIVPLNGSGEIRLVHGVTALLLI